MDEGECSIKPGSEVSIQMNIDYVNDGYKGIKIQKEFNLKVEINR